MYNMLFLYAQFIPKSPQNNKYTPCVIEHIFLTVGYSDGNVYEVWNE